MGSTDYGFGGGAKVGTSGGAIGGGGTLNRYAKFTPDGFDIGDALMSDDGTTITTYADIVPNADGTLNLGSATNRFHDIYLGSKIDYASDLNFVSGGTTNATFKTTGEVDFLSPDGNIVLGTVDAFARRQLWIKYAGGVFRMGSDTADGDPTNIDSEGIVIYHPSDDRLARIKADRFGLTASSDSSLYYFRADPTQLFFKDVSLNPIFYVSRANTNVGIGTSTADTSASLDIVSTTRGFLAPRMTTAQRNAIVAVEALLVYDTDIHQYFYYNGTDWLGI